MASLAHPIPVSSRQRWSPGRVFRGITPAEGWASVFLLGVVLLSTAWTVARSDVAPDGISMAMLATGGLLTGLGLAKLSTPDLLAHLFAILSGVFASLLLAVERMPLAPGGRLARLGALGDLGAQWLAQVQAGDPLTDPRLLSIMLGAAVWLVSYTSAWVLFRRGWLTTALALPGAIALANLGYAPEEGTLPLLVMVVAGTMLAARHAAYRREVEWSRAQLPYPRRTVARFLLGGIVISLLVAALAWTLPLSTRDSLFGAAWERINEPLEEVADRWNELISRFGGPGDNSGGSYSAFGDSFRLGGHLELSDDPVMLLEPSGGAMRPVYLAGQRYDAYNGHGWATTVDDTFQDVGSDGRRYSSRLSFRSGQGVHLSPDLLTDRSQVEAEMTVIRPKGNLIFTLDTYLAADRRTNVQLSWQQLANDLLPLVAGEVPTLPLDLQRIAALVARGSYTPPSDGGVNSDSPLPLDPSLAAEIQAERDALLSRFLDVGWEIGPDGRAQALRVSGQVPVYDDVEAVFSQDDVAQGDAYAVSGLTSTAGPDQLRVAGDDYPAWVTDRYLTLPETITDRTRELASQLAAGQSNAFDTAAAVEEFVRSTITYNEDIDAPPDNQDVVDYVLFESQEGYCEYYASAMAALLRAEGIPARVVGGYFPAPYDPNEGGHLYREKNAHLWVEVFFPGYGWIPFEPTANRDRLDYGDLTAPAQAPALPTPAPTPPPVVAEPTPLPVAETPADQPPPLTPPNLLSNPARLAGWIGLALAGMAIVAALAATTAWFVGFRGLSPVSSLYARALRAGNWLVFRPECRSRLRSTPTESVASCPRRRACSGRRRALHPGALRGPPARRRSLARRERRLARSAQDRDRIAPAPGSGSQEAMMAAMDPAPGTVLVAGAINTDLVARVARAPDAGETVTGSTFAIFGGGKGANQAIAAARSGAPTAMFGALGDDDFGRQRRVDLDAEGIDTGSVARSITAASGVAMIIVEEESGQNRISYVPGATMTLTPKQARAAVDRVRPVVLLTTLEPPPQTLDALVAASEQRGATIVLNATPEAIGAKLPLDRIGILIVNETEAEDLLGHAVSAANGEEAARSLSDLGPGTVVVTLGAAGAAVFHDGQTATFPAPSVDVVDTTGAGDAFCGAFAADLARGVDPFTAARTGVAAGSLATTIPGAYPGIPRRDAIERMLAKS